MLTTPLSDLVFRSSFTTPKPGGVKKKQTCVNSNWATQIDQIQGWNKTKCFIFYIFYLKKFSCKRVMKLESVDNIRIHLLIVLVNTMLCLHVSFNCNIRVITWRQASKFSSHQLCFMQALLTPGVRLAGGQQWRHQFKFRRHPFRPDGASVFRLLHVFIV